MLIEELTEHKDSPLSVDPYKETTYEFAKPTKEEKNQQLIHDFLKPSPELSWELLDLVQPKPDVDREKVIQRLVINPSSLNRTKIRFKRSGIEGRYQDIVRKSI